MYTIQVLILTAAAADIESALLTVCLSTCLSADLWLCVLSVAR